MKFLEKILDICYPPTCGICSKIGTSYLCESCYYELIRLRQIRMIREFLRKQIYYDQFVVLFSYEGIVKEKILDYKFHDKPYLANMFSEFIVKNEKICGFFRKCDIIIPVPIHNKEKRKRGYNSNELIANKLAENLDFLVVNTDSLLCQKVGIPSKDEPKVPDNYRIDNKEKLQHKRIVLLDDVYMTGHTVNECSRLLKQAGADNVTVVTLAKD